MSNSYTFSGYLGVFFMALGVSLTADWIEPLQIYLAQGVVDTILVVMLLVLLCLERCRS